MVFQEYAKAVEILWLAYFANLTSIAAIRRANFALESDAKITDGILKAAVLQADANNKNLDKTGAKNTFLYRLICGKLYPNLQFDICSIKENMHL